uniref:Sushi domain-containing protein n=1 Tax=Rhinolophus ferrumequinum TaxID=59479 RepID=A0A671FU89_RHIFE
MSPAWRGARAVLRLLRGLTILLLLLCPQAVRSDCIPPPDVPNATPALEGRTSFPEKSIVTYKCNKDFVKIPGKQDAVICLTGNKWSPIAEFCNRSCDVPTRLLFAVLKQPYNRLSYFPEGCVVEYECRLGYTRNHSLSGKATCLQNFTWSKPDEFCNKKSCRNPGEIINGYINITTDILFGASIIFSCNTGYKLIGPSSSYCIVVGDTVDWSDPLPECKESSQTSKVTPTPQKPTTVNIPATQSQAVTRGTTTFRPETLSVGVSTIASGLVAGTIIIGTLILVRIFWDYGKSGSYYTREDNKAQNAMFHNLTVTPDASEVRLGKL